MERSAIELVRDMSFSKHSFKIMENDKAYLLVELDGDNKDYLNRKCRKVIFYI